MPSTKMKPSTNVNQGKCKIYVWLSVKPTVYILTLKKLDPQIGLGIGIPLGSKALLTTTELKLEVLSVRRHTTFLYHVLLSQLTHLLINHPQVNFALTAVLLLFKTQKARMAVVIHTCICNLLVCDKHRGQLECPTFILQSKAAVRLLQPWEL